MKSSEASVLGDDAAVKTPRAATLRKIYRRLFGEFGSQDWWPAQSPFEVMVGAILTQNTNWRNVERAIENLRSRRLLSPGPLRRASAAKISRLIRPAGYFNVKAKRLKNFVEFLFGVYNGNLSRMAAVPLESLRRQLLGVNGIGKETADSILLYALDKPIFVIDAYTKRVLYRHGWIREDADYDDVQRLLEGALKKDVKLFNEYHALIVKLAKDYCRKKPLCSACPLRSWLKGHPRP